MAEITFVIPARNLDSLHRTLSMLSFQKDAGLRAVIVDFAGSEAIRAIDPMPGAKEFLDALRCRNGNLEIALLNNAEGGEGL